MIDREALDDAIVWINTRLRNHGGGIELVEVVDDPDGGLAAGRVTVRFAGMCTGCNWKAMTWFGTVKDALESVPGVGVVEAHGTAVSAAAEARVRSMLDRSPTPR
ncbi:MAG: NifU family protein [Ilumatobacter sp.]|uniref:NifU family protein n=1 Tax=Ilumatobacter sp. TaxID=1967498 RepID=UPI00391C444E